MFLEWMLGKIAGCLPFCLLSIVARHLKREKSHVFLPGIPNMLQTCFLRLSGVTVSPSKSDCVEIWWHALRNHIFSMCSSIQCQNAMVWHLKRDWRLLKDPDQALILWNAGKSCVLCRCNWLVFSQNKQIEDQIWVLDQWDNSSNLLANLAELCYS